MPCLHKFDNDLSLDWLSFEPEILIIGTFNPGWEVLNNDAPWFYGRIKNNYFWDVLPRLYKEDSLRFQNEIKWKEFCARNKIAITDLLQSINDADENNPKHVTDLQNFRDDLIVRKFNELVPNNIIKILTDHSNLRHVYFTRQLGSSLWDNWWHDVVNWCNLHNIRTQVLMTPSANARFQMDGGNLSDFIYEKWSENWHF